MTNTLIEDADDLHIEALNLTELLDQIDDVRNGQTFSDGPEKQRRIDALVSIAKQISFRLSDRIGDLTVKARAKPTSGD